MSKEIYPQWYSAEVLDDDTVVIEYLQAALGSESTKVGWCQGQHHPIFWIAQSPWTRPKPRSGAHRAFSFRAMLT